MANTPSPYVAGTITLTAGQANVPQNLWALVKAQIDADCSGAPSRVNIQTDSSGALFIGEQTNKVGALSNTNYGVTLATNGTSYLYSRNLSNSFAFANIYVLMTGAFTFHVEIFN